MVDWEPSFILPLMHHLMQEREYSLVQSIATDVAAADDDFHRSVLSAPQIVAESTFHATRDANRYRAELASESRRVELGVISRKLAGERLIRRVSPLGRPARARRGFRIPEPDQASERSKQRCGPGTKLPDSLDQMRVVTSIVFGPMLITLTDEGLPPRDLDDTVPAVEITVPLRVCSI